MSFLFKRPENLKFPTVYYTFKAKDIENENLVEYRVQDLPETYFKEALSLLVEHFLPDEELCSSRGLLKCDKGLKEVSDFWTCILKEKLSIGCFKNDELVGMNVLVVTSKNDPKDEIIYEDECWNDVLDVLIHMNNQINPFETFNVDQYLTAYGLVVHPKYHGRGIATEMLKARIPILKKFGLKVTVTIFTGIGSQMAAKKANYDDFYSIKYSELKEVKPLYNFLINAKSTYCKIMSLKI
ncbi:hypothetical protein PVAND_013573 [Polypedilum vanderplanki]|uniref:N-acetyltransferase domain-containing protein n=1 Tax=Polypedilum vanderplanki TaxID=319348 RepID=A0A9J6CPU2_POLVA|nr:hypothetical protein PVAND_013573 [Polypedilum vanderplanki]